jgi:hypothetical protein
VAAEFKGDELINVAEEMSRQSIIQAMVWLLLASFSQVYTEN